jgi:hypothetical protein
MEYSDALLVGSRALKYWYKDARDLRHRAHDFDFFIKSSALDEWTLKHNNHYRDVEMVGPDKPRYEMSIGLSIEFDTTEYESVKLFLEHNSKMPTMEAFGLKFRVASPSTLLAIKRSHIFWRHNWHKHIYDYSFMKSKNVEIIPEILEACDIRTKEREERGEFKRPVNLQVKNEDFFEQSDKAVRRKFDHDNLHHVIKYYDVPLFEKAKKDLSLASLDQDLFEKFDFIDKCRLVREEAYVIGLERVIMPAWYNQYLMLKNGMIDEICLDPNS